MFAATGAMEAMTEAVSAQGMVGLPKENVGARPDVEEIETRFGKVTIDRRKSFAFPRGILGMPDRIDYCLTDFPLKKLPQFRLLQSAVDDQLAFVTLPVEIENPFIEKRDILEAIEAVGIAEKDLAILLIVSPHRKINGMALSVNARAPVLIDVKARLAAQYVLPNSKYEIRHMLQSPGSLPQANAI